MNKVSFVSLEEDQIKTRVATPSTPKTIMFFARCVDFIKILSAPEVCFLMIVIAKTNYGTLSDVPIPRSDIIQNQTIPSLAIKQIREKLVSLGLIEVTQKRIGRGSEAWHYSLCCDKLGAVLSLNKTNGIRVKTSPYS